jgi:hypothetical protein
MSARRFRESELSVLSKRVERVLGAARSFDAEVVQERGTAPKVVQQHNATSSSHKSRELLDIEAVHRVQQDEAIGRAELVKIDALRSDNGAVAEFGARKAYEVVAALPIAAIEGERRRLRSLRDEHDDARDGETKKTPARASNLVRFGSRHRYVGGYHRVLRVVPALTGPHGLLASS